MNTTSVPNVRNEPENVKRYSFIAHEYNEAKIDKNDVPTFIPNYIELVKAIESINQDRLKEIIKKYYK
jgi:hypothetical protein